LRAFELDGREPVQAPLAAALVQRDCCALERVLTAAGAELGLRGAAVDAHVGHVDLLSRELLDVGATELAKAVRDGARPVRALVEERLRVARGAGALARARERRVQPVADRNLVLGGAARGER
jgi:hypothetical protein